MLGMTWLQDVIMDTLTWIGDKLMERACRWYVWRTTCKKCGAVAKGSCEFCEEEPT